MKKSKKKKLQQRIQQLEYDIRCLRGKEGFHAQQATEVVYSVKDDMEKIFCIGTLG